MSEYLTLAAKGREGQEDMLVCVSGRSVSTRTTTFTGLVDANGKEIYRVRNPIGFRF